MDGEVNVHKLIRDEMDRILDSLLIQKKDDALLQMLAKNLSVEEMLERLIGGV